MVENHMGSLFPSRLPIPASSRSPEMEALLDTRNRAERMEKAEELKIEDLNSYINGLKNDFEAVKNGIKYTYNNGLAEGSVNKIKLTKRIMYGPAGKRFGEL